MYLNLLAAVASLAFWFGNDITSVAAQPATVIAWDDVKQLLHASYFSDECRDEAAALRLVTSDADTLVTAVATLASKRIGRRDADPSGMRPLDCDAPVVLLMNLLRLNGIRGDIAFVSMSQVSSDVGQRGRIDRVLVYVPALDRYIDPTLPPGREVAFDREVRERGYRIHLSGPSADGAAPDACRDLCLRVIGAGPAERP